MTWSLRFVINSMLLGVGLAMDAFSVSLANGLHEPRMGRRRMAAIAGVFAGFQALMPLLGWICVHTVVQLFAGFEAFIPWIALILLAYIGGKMLLEGFTNKEEEEAEAVSKGGLVLQGIATSIDCVSETSGVFREKVIPALKYCTYAILNEIEAASVSGIPARGEDGALDDAGIVQTMRFFLQCGVSGKVIVHAPEAGYLMDKSGYALKVPSLELPEGFIKGKVGAGDAFCAGALHGLITGMNDEEVLRFASAAAASSLSAKDATSGMGNRVEILALDSWFKRQKGTRLC